MPTNFYMFFVAAFIPLIIGYIYYNPKVLGNSWMRVNGFSDKDMENGNMLAIFGLTYLVSIMAAFFLASVVIHQGNVFQMMLPAAGETGSAAQQQFNSLMTQYGDAHRNFGHGFLHGSMTGLFLIMPIIAVNALFERRGWKYIWLHTGYWFISLGLMGGLLCATLQYAPLG